MRRAAMFTCLGLFCTWILLLIAQIWGDIIDGEAFVKLTLTMGGLFVIAFSIFIVLGQIKEDKQLRDDNFIN